MVIASEKVWRDFLRDHGARLIGGDVEIEAEDRLMRGPTTDITVQDGCLAIRFGWVAQHAYVPGAGRERHMLSGDGWKWRHPEKQTYRLEIASLSQPEIETSSGWMRVVFTHQGDQVTIFPYGDSCLERSRVQEA